MRTKRAGGAFLVLAAAALVGCGGGGGGGATITCDLAVVSVDVPDGAYDLTHSLDVSISTYNYGPDDCPSYTVALYLSHDIFVRALEDTLIGSESRTGGLASGATDGFTASVSWSNPPGGSYYVGMIVTYAGDANALNNAGYDPAPIVISPGGVSADLYDDGDASNGFTPTTVIPGDGWSAWCDVRNGGDGDAGAFSVDFYASADTIITTSDHLLGTVFVSSGVSVGSYADADLSLSSFPSVPGGTYYVGWIIDGDNGVFESNEFNNVAYESSYTLLVTAANLPPQAALSATPTFGEAPLRVDFDASASSDVDGTIVSYEWDFDYQAGNFTVEKSTGANPTTFENYTSDGAYLAAVRVTDDDGATAIATVSLLIGSATIWVDAVLGSDTTGDGSSASPYRTIDKAMQNAQENAVVVVRPGAYQESVSIPHYGMALRSEQGPDVTVIQGTGSGSENGVNVPSSASSTNVLIEGFTIRGFYRGVYAWDGASVRNCIFEENRSTGVLIHYAKGSNVVGNIFRNNTVSYYCLYFGGESAAGVAAVANNLFVQNTGNVVIMDSYGGTSEEVLFENNTVAYNSGNGVFVWNGGSITLSNNIVAFNGGYGIRNGDYAVPAVRCCDVYQNLEDYYNMTSQTGIEGNISADPLFVDASGGDYRILSSSPCRDTGLDTGYLQAQDIRGQPRVANSVVDMGCYEWQTGDP